MLSQIRKRNGDIVPFDSTKIAGAIFKALLSTEETNPSRSDGLSEIVVSELEAGLNGQHIYDVEEVQDRVEKILISDGLHATALAYMNYRQKHEADREKKRAEHYRSIQKTSQIEVILDGESHCIEKRSLLQQIRMLAAGLQNIQSDEIVDDALKFLYKNATLQELERNLVNSVRSRIERDPDYDRLASRLLIYQLYSSLLPPGIIQDISSCDFSTGYRNGFHKYIVQGVEAEKLLNPALQSSFDIGTLISRIRPERDFLFPYRGAQTVLERYLLRGRKNGEIFELPQYFWMRVAMGLTLNEPETIRTEKAIEFYHMMSSFQFVPSTPTLFNAGTLHPQLSSCFTNSVQDSLQDIFNSYTEAALLSKFAGGIGTDWTPVRSLGSEIIGTNGKSQGVIPFLKIFNDIAVAVNQGGKRKGALAAYLEVWHGDVEHFIEAKKNTGDERRRLHDIHTALWIPDLFMERVMEKSHWTLFSPADVPDLHSSYGQEFREKYIAYESANFSSARRVDALTLWRKILSMLFETGHPWLTFKDPCNIRSPQQHVGVVNGSNLCTEITLNSGEDETAVCNLGSINLSKFVDEKGLMHETLRETVKSAVRLLDNVIELNYYPTEKARNANMRHRAVGLGLMGYQDALYIQRIPFASEKNLQFADQSMEAISYYAIEASSQLAMERGVYSSFKGSLWDLGIFPLDSLELLAEARGRDVEVHRDSTLDWDRLKEVVKRQGMRHSNLMAIAPTATISNISGTTPSIEPAFRNLYTKENVDGAFLVVNEYLVRDLMDLGLWDKAMLNRIKAQNGSVRGIDVIPRELQDLYESAYEIDSRWLIDAAALRGKWIDQSASLNLFIQNTSGNALSELYLHAYRSGLKTTYYLRTLGATSIQKSSIEEEMHVADDDKAGSKNHAALTTLSTFSRPKNDSWHDILKSEPSLCKINDPECEVCQ